MKPDKRKRKELWVGKIKRPEIIERKKKLKKKWKKKKITKERTINNGWANEKRESKKD